MKLAMNLSVTRAEMAPDGWPMLGIGIVCLLVAAIGVGLYIGTSLQRSRRRDTEHALARAKAETAHWRTQALTSFQAQSELEISQERQIRQQQAQLGQSRDEANLLRQQLRVATDADADAESVERLRLHGENKSLTQELERLRGSDIGQLVCQLVDKDRQLAVQENLIARLEGRTEHRIQA